MSELEPKHSEELLKSLCIAKVAGSGSIQTCKTVDGWHRKTSAKYQMWNMTVL